jgi:NADPH:quinone reductase-like Zn-dependent oxidoreductase/NADP-dependent 3-hydroxy acid dehydrogenase YdfG/acyl carrier protein
MRVIARECPGVACRQVDLARVDDAAIDWLAGELVSPVHEPLVAWREGKRWAQEVRVEELGAAEGGAGLRERGVYLITGGFGSMGLAFARELARAVRARIVLLGRTAPSVEKLARIREIEALGGEVLSLTADVSDRASLAKAVEKARQRFGAIHGVIHTAGVYGQGAMWERPEAAVRVTWAPKVAGTLALAEPLRDEKPDFLVLCASLAASRPVAGQADYCAANAFLDAWAGEQARRTGTRTISIEWGMWQELGMMEHASIAAAQKQSVRDEILREGWQDAGIAAFRRIVAHAKAGTVLVSPQPLRDVIPPAHPLLTERTEAGRGRVDYGVRLDPKTHWVVNEHRLDGLAILPGTAYLELARAAFADFSGATAVELSEVYFLRPLLFERDEARDVRVILRDGTFHIVSSVGPDRWLEHARGEVRAVTGSGQAAKASAAGGVAEPMAVPADAVKFGPRWRNLRTLAFGTSHGVAELALAPELAADVEDYALHPALLDMATGFITLRHALPDSLPFSYRRVVMHAPLTPRLRSTVRVVERTDVLLEMDATLTDEAAAPLVTIEGYRLRRMPAAPSAAGDNVRLAISAQGGVDSLMLVRAARRAPAPGEVEIQIEAAGLNFIEVLYALGMLPASPELENSFGLECAGRIVAVGVDVKDFAVGDAVVAYANGCFAAFVTAPANAVAKRPAGVSAAEAATLPAAFATAHHALVTQGRLAAGERVLIHAAAGGVGMAAVQIAQRLGAEVFATAGSPEKRAALQALGVKHVMDSRSLAFADEVKAATNGRGVDVVLNSLGGEFLNRSLELVAPRGRFLELGKRDLFKGGALPLQPFTRIISFIVIDVGPDLPGFAMLWREVAERFASGTYRPLPHTAFALTKAREAFDFMARAKHLGKVVLTVDDLATLRSHATAARAPAVGRSLAAILGTEESTKAEPSSAASDQNPKSEIQSPKSPEHARPDLGTDYVAPADEVEIALAAIWQELLGIERIGTRDNFFDLNGDSLLAAQVTARVHTALQVKLPLSVLFDAPTIAELAERVRKERGGRPAAVATTATATGGESEEGEI